MIALRTRFPAQTYVQSRYDDEYLDDGDEDDGFAPGEREAIRRQELEEEEAAHAEVYDRLDLGECAIVI